MADELIDLGSISWDISAIESQIVNNKKQIDGFSNTLKSNKEALKQQSKELQDTYKSSASLTQAKESLNAAYREGSVSEEEFVEKMAKTNQELEQNKQKTVDAIKAQSELIQANIRAENAIKTLNNENRNLTTLMRAGRTESQESINTYKNLNEELNALKLEAKDLGAELVLMEQNGQKNTEAYKNLELRWKDASEAADDLNDKFKAIDKAVGDTQRSVGDYTDSILKAAKQIESLSGKQKDLKDEQKQLDKAYELGTVTLDDYNKRSELLGKSIDRLTNKIDALREAEAEARAELEASGEAQEFYQNQVMDSLGGIKDGIGEIISGNVSGGFNTLKDSVKNLKNTFGDLFNFIKANPWILLVGALVAYTKAVIDHNQYITEANAQTENLAHTTGELTNELRRAGEAISKTFEDKSSQEAIIEMDSLMDDFKISSQEAWDVYVRGLAAGGAANDGFGDSIKEYGSLFAQNGYSAQQFINILNTGINLGIYSDKLPDAIKEAGLALNEQTKGVRDALINAFGASFTDTLLKNIQQGRLTVAQALDQIADKAEQTNLNQQQQAQLTADLFKGAGEDAGGAVAIFDALNKAQNITSDNLTDLQKQTALLANLNLEVEKSKDAAFANDSVRAFRKEFEVTWKSIQIGWYRAIAGASEFFQGAFNGFELIGRNVVDTFKAIPLGFREASKSIGSDLNKLGQLGSTAGDILKKAFTLDVDGAKASYNDLKNQLKNFNSDYLSSLSKIDDYLSGINAKNVKLIKDQNAAKAEAQRLADEAEAKRNAAGSAVTGATGDALAKAAAEAQKKAEAEAKKAETKRIADAKKAAAEAQKTAEELAKKDLEVKRNNAQQAVDIAKNELAEYIRLNADKYKDDKRLTDLKLKDQLAYFDEVARKQKEANELERKSKELAIQQKIEELEKKKELNATELADIASMKISISILSKDAAQADAEVDKQTAEKKKEINKIYYDDLLEQQRLSRAIAYQQEILDLEIQGGKQKEILLAQEDQRFQDLLDKFAEQNKIKLDLDQDQYITDQEIQIARDALQDQYDTAKDERERLRVQNQLDALDYMAAQSAENIVKINEMAERAKLSAISDTFGQAKSLFKENTLAYKAMAVAEATISTYLSVTKTLAEYPGPVGWAMSAVQIALGLANVAKIVGVKGFSKGGYTGDGAVNEIAGVVHKGEVVWSQADVQAMGGAAVVNAMRPTGGGFIGDYFGSTVGVSDMPSVQSAMMGGAVVVMLDENSVSLIADATYAGSQKGIGDMADNTDIRLGANFG